MASIPGVKRFWGGSNSNDSGGEKGIVQHIPLTGPSSAPAPQSQSQPQPGDQGTESPSSSSSSLASSNVNGNNGNSNSTKPPNPPSLLEQDINRINTTYEQFQTQIQNQLNEIEMQQQLTE